MPAITSEQERISAVPVALSSQKWCQARIQLNSALAGRIR
jgi:hypothetical protein